MSGRFSGAARRRNGGSSRWSHRCLLVLVALLAAACDSGETGPAAVTRPAAPETPKATPAIDTVRATRYFFDVYDHTPAEIAALLRRARATHDGLPETERDGVTIALVLHGPDVTFFANENYDEHRELVDLAADLDRLGYVDLKICTTAARSRGLEADRFPPFIEFVPYAPAELKRLETEGYVRF